MNFANMQTPSKFGKMYPLTQLSADLSSGILSNFSYIVPNECNDMHGAPPWCVDSGNLDTAQQSRLIAQGDKFVGEVVRPDHLFRHLADGQQRDHHYVR